MPKNNGIEIPPEAQAQMLAALRRARYGYLLTLHILLLCAAGRTPTDIAAALFCSRSSVYRTVRAYRKRTLGWEQDAQGRLMPPIRTMVLPPDAAAVARGVAQGHPTDVWMVPHALELRHAGRDTEGQAGGHGLGRDHAALAPRDRLGLEARQTRGQRRRSAPR